MKKITLAVLLVVLVATPCFAQEVDTDGLFSIEGTLWNVFTLRIEIGVLNGKPYFPPPEYHSDSIGFYQGTVRLCSENRCVLLSDMSYIDTPEVSIAYGNRFYSLYIMRPIGIGIVVRTSSVARSGFFPDPIDYQGVVYSLGIMFKVDNDWAPPEVEDGLFERKK